MSPSESDADDVLSERETQFVYQSGDEDVLWAVQEITAERGNKYKVKWAGTDPDTGKPWPQSWVAKHDCTDDLVIAWKNRRRQAAGKNGKRGRRRSTTSRISGASKQAGSSTSGAITRRSTSKGTSSRLDSVEEHVSLLPKQTPVKRKRQSETPATTPSGAVQADERGESSRPHKKQKSIVEVLLPPLSSDEDEVAVRSLNLRAKDAVQNEEPGKGNSASGDGDDGDDSSPPEAQVKSRRRSDTQLKGTTVNLGGPDVREPPSKAEAKVVSRRKGRVDNLIVSSDEREDEDEDLRPPRSNKLTPKRKSPSERRDEKGVEPMVFPIKIGPPRGIKRQQTKSRSSNKPGPSRSKPRRDDPADERLPPQRSTGHLDHNVPSSGNTLLLRENMASGRISPPQHISIPHVPLSTRPRSPDLSPWAQERLNDFDRLMAEPEIAPAPPCVSEHVADVFNVYETHDTCDAIDTFAPPPGSLSPPKSKTKHSKLGTPNGLVVPETESSANSQSQSRLLLKPPPPSPRSPLARDQSPRKLIDLPTITVIAASATSSSTSPQDFILPPKLLPPSTDRPSKRLSFMAPNAFCSTSNTHSRATDPEPPPSSIESFTSPGRIDKGKQKAVEDNQPPSSLSEAEGDGQLQKGRMQKKATDSELKKRGKELFDQAQLAREAVWQKDKKSKKRMKTIEEIINGAGSSSTKGSPLQVPSGVGSTPALRLEDVVDLNGGVNSMTLDTPEHSEVKLLSDEQRERLRIELRQEEEESTQEAMGIYPPPETESKVMPDEDSQMPPPRSPKSFSFNGNTEDIDRIEFPSTDLLQASVIVQASQERRHEDTDNEPLPANQPASSPPRPIPENLTDSPKRRLGEALSLLNVKSEEIQRLERELVNTRKILQGLETELAQLQQSSEPTAPVRAAWDAERVQWTQERSKWEKDFSMWESQRKEMSEERENHSARLAELSDAAVRAEEAGVKVSELEAERVAWTKERDAMLNDIAQRSDKLALLAQVRGEHNQDQLKWEADRTLWAEEKVAWETERAALQGKHEALSRSLDELTASVESMKAAKASAEKDRDFFREQYAQASAFVGSVRDENAELEKRVEIAEGQAHEGVAAIRALLEGQIKVLQADVDRWKGLTELLREKDRRTDDELRRRAAQTPELVELCSHLDIENKALEADIRRLGRVQQRSVHRRNKLFREILSLKKERESLRSKLAKSSDSSPSNQETSQFTPAPLIPDDPENIYPNDIEILPNAMPQSLDTTFDEPALFPCMWRPQWRDQCQQIFDTKEDLERHMQDHFRDLLAQ